MPLNQAQALLSWVTLTGQLHANSYYYADLPPERFDLLKRAIPSHNLLPRPVDLFDRRTPRVWLLEDTRREIAVLSCGAVQLGAPMNRSHIDETFKKIGLPLARST